MKKHSKLVKRLLREYSAEAYERELHRELAKLDDDFAAWRQGQIGSGELDHRIHKYKQGPARELWKQYNYGQAHLLVAYAIVTGILDADEMPGELLEALSAPLGMYRDWQARGELREPGDQGP
jgi:hypothetical protein